MTASPATPAKSAGWRRASWRALPSWSLSLAFHGLLLLICSLLLHEQRPLGNPNALEGSQGVYFEGGTGGGTGLLSFGDPGGEGPLDESSDLPGDSGDPGPPGESAGTGSGQGSGESPLLDDTPPVKLELPSRVGTRVGLGLAGVGDVGGGLKGTVRSSGIFSGGDGAGGGGTGAGGQGGQGGRGGGGGGGGGGTSFFGAKARGARFVYLLDASGSMLEHGAIRVAKAELLASLEKLDATQQFQILFYNEKYVPMLDPSGKAKLFAASDVNRTLASQFISSVQPDGGTRHKEAILEALNYVPEVLFFLTDAGEPRLEAADLDRIKRRNGGRTQIFAIEFGKGPNLRGDVSFLKKLARENGGGYVYHDVMQFGKK